LSFLATFLPNTGTAEKEEGCIVTQSEHLQLGSPPDPIPHTKDHFKFWNQKTLILFDIDGVDKPIDKIFRILSGIIPDFKGSEKLTISSSSSGLYLEGKLLKNSTSVHVYCIGKNGTDIPRFIKVLSKQLWLEGHGHIEISKAGSMLIRSLIDAAVGAPERIIYEASPILNDGITQKRPDPKHIAGTVLDTSILLDLSEDEEKRYRKIVDAAKFEIKPESNEICKTYDKKQMQQLIEKTGISEEVAREAIQARREGVLNPDDIIYLTRNKTIQVKHINESYHQQTCCDPLEPSYNGWHDTVAKIYVNDSSVVVNSNAHGGAVYQVVDESQSENQNGKKSMALLIIETITQNTTFFHDPDDTPFARYAAGKHKEIWALESQQFKRWVGRTMYEKIKLAPNKNAMTDAINVLAGQAVYDGDELEVHVRVAQVDGSYFLDPCFDDWRLIKIDPGQWQVTDGEKERVAFRRTSTMRALPMPELTSFTVLPELFTKHFNMSEHHARLTIAYLIECLMPDTEYPVMEITGSPGSGKSTIQEMIRDSIDPNKVNLRAAPKTIEDIFVSAVNNHLVSYNNLSRISPGQSDALCSLATGGGHAGRKLFTNTDESATDVKKPVILNGIGHLAKMPDLIDRLIKITLQPIPGTSNKPKKQVMDDFNDDLPKILGSLLDLFSKILELLPEIKLDQLPRMADFAKLCEAITQVYKWDKSLLQTYYENRTLSFEDSLETSPAIMAVVNLVNEHGSYKGTVGSLYLAIEMQRKEHDSWIKTARGLGEKLRLNTPALKAVGITVDFDQVRHNDGYHVTLSQRNESTGKQRSQPSQCSRIYQPNLYNSEGSEHREHITPPVSRTPHQDIEHF